MWLGTTAVGSCEKRKEGIDALPRTPATLSRLGESVCLSRFRREGDVGKRERATPCAVGSGVGEEGTGERRMATDLTGTRWRYTLGLDAANGVSVGAAALLRQRAANRCSSSPDHIVIQSLPSIGP
ncbi:hypothetical protein MRX96_048910 [Rhipicephalus microplus]